MAALTSDRNSIMAAGDLRDGASAAGELIYGGAIVMRNAAGFLVAGETVTGLIGVGRAEKRVDNTSGANGDQIVLYRPGVFLFENSGGADDISEADIGAICYAVDDQTVAKTDDSGARSPAGFVDMVDDTGVFVRFDEAITRNIA